MYTLDMINVNKLSKFFNQVPVLQDIDFSVNKEEKVGILGKTDSGKTTLLQIITGCLYADSGSVLINGYDITKQGRRAKSFFGYVPSVFPVYNEMTVGKYLTFAGKLRGVSDRELERSVFETLKTLSAEQFMNTRIDTLTNYEKKVVSLAQALISKPEILIIDAPTEGMNPEEARMMRQQIADIQGPYTTIICSSRMYEVLELCSRIIILNKGRVVADREVDDFQEKVNEKEGLRIKVIGNENRVRTIFEAIEKDGYGGCYVEKGYESNAFTVAVESNIDLRKRIFEDCVKADVTILEMRRTSLSIEDVFFQLTSEGGL
jgi:ABC-2 type transport system ATP-binding protein